MFRPRRLKHSIHFRKGVEKFVNYKRHLMEEADIEAIQEGVKALRVLEASRAPAEELTAKQEEVESLCRAAVPGGEIKEPGWVPENIEVLFTAIVIALGIRAYFLQPFKIPTGSMQPTLNGVIAEEMAEDEPFPNLMSRAFQQVWNGRRYFEVRAPETGSVVGLEQKSFLLFFTWTEFKMKGGSTFKVPAPKDVALHQLKMLEVVDREYRLKKQNLDKGELVVRGWVQGGDNLLVDKVSYHFRRPKRGEVFVFQTKGIIGIEEAGSYKPEFGSQHYIKRLVGVPGDTLEITPDRKLLVNGKVAEEEGMRKVMSAADGYNGYLDRGAQGKPISLPRFELKTRAYYPAYWRKHRVAQPVYYAMGDNQMSSLDGRYWGPVPQVNVVGPAMLVYWPFGNHFGLIR